MKTVAIVINSWFIFGLLACSSSKFCINDKINQLDADKKKQGVWITHEDSTGKLIVAKYRNDLIDGYYKKFYESGQLNVLGKYKGGKKNGEWKIFLENGNVGRKVVYKSDSIVGNTIYHPSWK